MVTFRDYIDLKFKGSTLWALSIILFVVSKLIQFQWLDKSYALSKYPVSFFEGQTTFDAAETKAHLSVLIENDTLNVFWQTQIIDFAYIIATFVFTLVVMAAIYKMLSFSTRFQDFSWLMVLLMPLNSVFDAMENLVSFLMLSDPTDFADWLIIPYSSFAATKFALYLIGYLWIVIALIIRFTVGRPSRLSPSIHPPQ